MKDFLEKVKAILQTAWGKIYPALKNVWGKVKAAIDKLPFNGFAAKAPVLARVAAYANYAFCVVVLVVVVAVIGGVSGRGKKSADEKSPQVVEKAAPTSEKVVTVCISNVTDSTTGELYSYWKATNGKFNQAVKKGGTFVVPEFKYTDGSRTVGKYTVSLGGNKSISLKAGAYNAVSAPGSRKSSLSRTQM